MSITEQQKDFVNEYIKLRCRNATQAAINAGYSEKTARQQASDMLTRPHIQEFLKEQKTALKEEIWQSFIFECKQALDVEVAILESETASDRDKLTAAKDILDRAGFKATDKTDTDIREQLARIAKLEAETARIKGEGSDDNPESDGFIEALRNEVADVWEE